MLEPFEEKTIMAKQQQKPRPKEDVTVKSNFSRRGDILGIVTLAGVIGLMMISFANWREIDQIQTSLDARLGQIDNRIGQVSAKVDNVSARPAAQPTRRGPDPNRVYDIKTAGSPSKGPAGAPITIAEFSDFQ
jgi:hypothetical protein